MAWVDRPGADDLERAVGYVQFVQVEQLDARDAILFRLEEWEYWSDTVSRRFAIYLDVGTTVALAQLQLLRDAMIHRFAVAIYFLDDTRTSGPDDPTGFRFAYEVMVIPVALGEAVITEGTLQW